MNLALKIDNVSFAYRQTLILENVSLSINAGEYIGIIGPNGGGKTTLLKLIMGFLHPLLGSIEVFGVSPQEARKKIAYVPQSLQYDCQFPISVMELVLSGRLSHTPWFGRYRSVDKTAALNILETMGLAKYGKFPFGSLSGGLRQRALIARALISEPSLLLLDEPTANVDAEAESEIFSILHGLKNQVTILMVTHDLKTATEQVERILCVQRTTFMLKPEEVCEHFAIGLYHGPLRQPPPARDP